MKIRCGIDIIEVERIQETIETLGEKFLKRVFTNKEIEYCINKKGMSYQHFAVRFAAKEAIFKAISEEIEGKYDISWKNIEITNNETGRPMIEIIQKEELNKKIQDIDVSLSHIKEYAIANCVILFK